MSKVSDLHKKWSQDPEYRQAYDALVQEFGLARSLIQARADECAGRPYLLNWEQGGHGPSEIQRCRLRH